MQKSFILSTMHNQDGRKYGTAYFFFPKTAGYPVANPEDYRNIQTDDVWSQILVKEFDSLEDAQKYADEYQQDI